MNIGVDIIDITDLQKKINSSSNYLSKLLVEQEISGYKIESIAGRIAAKEAIMKTGFIKPGEWKKILILSKTKGEPIVLDNNGNKLNNLKISISHTKSTAIAIAIYENN